MTQGFFRGIFQVWMSVWTLNAIRESIAWMAQIYRDAPETA